MQVLATVQIDQSRWLDASVNLERAADALQEMFSESHPHTLSALELLAKTLEADGTKLGDAAAVWLRIKNAEVEPFTSTAKDRMMNLERRMLTDNSGRLALPKPSEMPPVQPASVSSTRAVVAEATQAVGSSDAADGPASGAEERVAELQEAAGEAAEDGEEVAGTDADAAETDAEQAMPEDAGARLRQDDDDAGGEASAETEAGAETEEEEVATNADAGDTQAAQEAGDAEAAATEAQVVASDGGEAADGVVASEQEPTAQV
jgi:hypothetical protein